MHSANTCTRPPLVTIVTSIAPIVGQVSVMTHCHHCPLYASLTASSVSGHCTPFRASKRLYGDFHSCLWITNCASEQGKCVDLRRFWGTCLDFAFPQRTVPLGVFYPQGEMGLSTGFGGYPQTYPQKWGSAMCQMSHNCPLTSTYPQNCPHGCD